MKRNMELVRKILLAMEACGVVGFIGFRMVSNIQ